MKYLIIALCVFLLMCSPSQKSTKYSVIHPGTTTSFLPALKPFYHGVASGDPDQNSVTIWTRITPDKKKKSIPLTWEVANSPSFAVIEQRGTCEALPENDYTVNPRIEGLKHSTYYYFRFSSNGIYSSTGRTKTTPSGRSSELKFAVVSCSNFEAGYFNAYARIGELEDLDAVIHLGDYIYEYGQDVYGDKSLNRKHLPANEIIHLNEYRTRYAQYRLDEDLQRAHQLHPFITIWDDHEISNNAFVTGAQNHDETREGTFSDRKKAARKAYYEWLPVSPTTDSTLYRSISYGDLVDWIMLDERLAGRTQQSKSPEAEDYKSSDRSMLGKKQLNWFKEQLSTSSAKWKLIGNQVIFADRDFSSIERSKSMDAWDGYPYEKSEILTFLGNQAIQDVVFLSGDTHSSWAFEVPESIASYEEKGPILAFEFGSPSISSANSNESAPDEEVMSSEQKLLATNPHMKYINMRDHGYLLLTVRETEIIAEWYYVDTLNKRSIKQHLGERVRILSGGRNVVR